MSTLQGFYLSFSGESNQPINNIYALGTTGSVVSKEVLDPSQTYNELRGIVFGPDGNFYVAQAHKNNSAILQFAGNLASGSSTRAFLAQFVVPSDSSGLLHPYQPIFGSDGNLYVSSQDTNVVSCFFGPMAPQPGQAAPNSEFLQTSYPQGVFNPGTFVAAFSADSGVPPFTPVPVDQGGLTLTDKGSSTHSVRGIAFDGAGNLYVADEGNDRVAVFDNSGNLRGAITESKNHSVQEPVALCFDAPSGLLYIGSPGNQRLFTFDVSQVAKGNFQANVLIHDDNYLDKVSGIALDPNGNIYTGSRKENAIYQWSNSGNLMGLFAGPFPDSPEQILAVTVPIVGG